MHRALMTLSLILCLQPHTIVSAKNLAEDHKNFLEPIGNLKVRFEQETFLALRKRTIKKSGTGYFKKPNKFVWDIQDPKYGDEAYYYNGSLLSHYIANEKLVTHYGTKSFLNKNLNQLVALILEPKSLRSRFEIKPLKSKENKGQYELTPLDLKASELTRIKITLDKEKKFLTVVQMLYTSGNATTFKFFDADFNMLADTLFTFSKTKEVTVKVVK